MSSSAPEVVAIIPARYASTRFPGKVLAPLAGKPVVQHVYERARAAQRVSRVLVAADDVRVAEALAPFGTPVVMTRPDHPSGTDRLAEVASELSAPLLVNVQGDEPLLDPAVIDAAVAPLLAREDVVMATVRARLLDPTRIADPNVVKVVCAADGTALYFSRAPIPHVRDEEDRARAEYWQHIGLYVYRREFLLHYAQLPPTPLEKLEKLEQLRALENGHKIAVVDADAPTIGVDTPEDLERVARLLEAREG